MLHELVKVVIPENVRCAIRNNKLHLVAAKNCLNLLDCGLPGDVAFYDSASFYRSHLKQVNRDNVGFFEELFFA